jgi:uncharacterized protein
MPGFVRHHPEGKPGGAGRRRKRAEADAEQKGKTVLVILKATTACNLACTYCYGDYGGNGGNGKNGGTAMSMPLAIDFARQLPSILKEGEPVEILWHGGEPTLLASDTFEEIQGFLNEALSSRGHAVTVSMQSNGFSISQQWREAIRRFDVGLGISMDGPSFLHDIGRPTKRGTPSGEDVARTVRSLCDEGIFPSLLCVVSAKHAVQFVEIADWMEEMRLPVRFNPLFASERSENAIPPQAYFDFLQALFCEICERSMDISVQPLKWMLTSVLYGKAPTECSFDGHCGKSFVALFPTGDVGVCGRSPIVYGNIGQATLVEMWTGEERKRLLARQTNLAEHCGPCLVRQWCNGGCQAIFGESPSEDYCQGVRDFFTFLATGGMDRLQQSIVTRRATIREELRELQGARENLTTAHERAGSGDV